jgi:hypothetical protein
LISCSVWDEDVLNVEHVLTFMTVLGACVAGARVFIPDENLGKRGKKKSKMLLNSFAQCSVDP